MRKSFCLHHECIYKDQRGTRLLSPLLLEILPMKASEPRDKIYALRSGFGDVFGNMPVDYSAPINDIYNEATHGVILHDKSLEILEEVGHGGNWDVAWGALDWDSDFSESLLLGAVCEGGSRSFIKFSSDYRMVLVRVKPLDRIVALSGSSMYLTAPLGKVSDHQLEAGKTDGWYWPPLGDMEPLFKTVARFVWAVHAAHGQSRGEVFAG